MVMSCISRHHSKHKDLFLSGSNMVMNTYARLDFRDLTSWNSYSMHACIVTVLDHLTMVPCDN